MNKFTPELIDKLLKDIYIKPGFDFYNYNSVIDTRVIELTHALNSYLFKFQINDVINDS